MNLIPYLLLAFFAFAPTTIATASLKGTRPNIIILFADDYGYGDVGHNNPEVKETVAIDALAAGGITFKDMHTFPLCTPSRAQLLTGRVGLRTGVVTNFVENSKEGLPLTEKTIAELLEPAGYDTAMLGKWHLGTHVNYHPSYRGFQNVLSVPFSVDMGCMGPANGPYHNLPQPPPCPTGPNTKGPNFSGPPALALYNTTTGCAGKPCNTQIAQQPVKEDELDRNYGDFLRNFIMDHGPGGKSTNPFFAYMAFSHTHVPLFFDPKFANSSSRKTVFADTTMELDDTVNRIWQAVKDAGLEEDTLILGTADNGPWAIKCELAGSPGPYTGEYLKKLGGGSSLKDTTWEGGQRVFGIAYWKGKINPLVSNATVSSMDYLPTILSLAGVPLPTDRQYDGKDLTPLFSGEVSSVRDFLFMDDTISGEQNVTAVRYKNLKAYSRTYSQASCKEPASPPVDHPDYLVFDLEADPSESTPVRPSQDIMDLIHATHKEYLFNISSTFRSVTNYSSGTMVEDGPCCNGQNAVCRCNASG